MELKSRTEYSAWNTTAAVFSRITAIVAGYILRIIFTHTLSTSYVGIDGLFRDIIQVLSLSEMGVGTAITYALYRPIAERDIEKQKSLLKMFYRFYQFVAILVALLGLGVVPFLKYLIRDEQQVGHLILIYLLHLCSTVCSYLWIYKKTLMDANQMLYIGISYQTISWIIQDILQAAVLLIWKNYIAFLFIGIATTICCNFCISKKADKLYPFLKNKDARMPEKNTRRAIFKNVRAMMMHKVGMVIVNNTDNLLISAFVDLLNVGRYSNYYLVIGSISQLLNQVYQGITASVGNLGVTEDTEHIQKVFDASFFIGQWLSGFSAICLYELLNPFIAMSFGEKYVFDVPVVFVLCLNFYLNGMRNAVLTFRDSMGLFYYDRYKAIVEAVLNLFLSIVLCFRFGVLGVFLGTALSMLLTSIWVEPYILYKYGFQRSGKKYFVYFFWYCICAAAAGYVADYLCRMILPDSSENVIMILLGRAGICAVLPNIIFFLCHFHSKEFRFVMQKAKRLFCQKRRKN